MGTIIAGKRPQLLLRVKQKSINKVAIVKFLKDLKKYLAGRKLLLFWDGLPAHRAKIVSQFIASNNTWLRVERLPAYAPELNPVEYLWSAFKKHTGNSEPNLKSLTQQARRARKRFSDEKLLKGFLRASGLYD